MSITKQTKIAVLLGGLSKERDVSLRTGKALAQALRTKGYVSVEEIDVGFDVMDVLRQKRIEAALIALHGTYGEDGTIQGLLEYLKIPYTGSGVVGSAVAMDKLMSKRLFRDQFIPTPAWIEANAFTPIEQLKKEIANKLEYPCIVKPNAEGSTLGLSKVESADQVEAAQRKALEHGDTALWEQFIAGKEYTISVLDGVALPLVEIVPLSGLFDYEAKYTKGKTEYFCPARVDEADAKVMQKVALQAFHSVGAKSFGRVDVMYANGQAWVLEVNTIPGMTETSLLPKAAKAAGVSFEDVAEKILLGASLKVRS